MESLGPTVGHAKRGRASVLAHGKRGLRLWSVAAVLVVVAGVVASFVAARVDSENSSGQTRAAFRSSAVDLASTLKLAIQHEQDLVVSGGAYIGGNPDGSQAQFLAWATAIRALARYPELQGLGFVVVVPAAKLPEFAAAHARPGAYFSVFPPGKRPFYCLGQVGVARGALSTVVGVDYCATSATTLTTRDTGVGTYYPVGVGQTSSLGIDTPVYRGGIVPATVAARRRMFLGWLGEAINPAVLLGRALQGRSGDAVSLRYERSNPPVIFTSGVAKQHAASTTIDLHNGWQVTVTGHLPAGGLLGDQSAGTILIGGSALSVLLGLLLFVLATARIRALLLVEEKTRQLGYQALHDGLTGLPNRALVLDRIEQLLARYRRKPDGIAAALFVDIDGFKRINDTYGHAAGDHVLTVVGDRLKQIVREEDTVGRLGGDEFVVVLESTTPDAPAGLVAARVIDGLRRPIMLPDTDNTVTISASVGVAVGQRDSADDLLGDADFALYEAKRLGKDRYVLFEERMHIAAQDRIELEADLSQALEQGQFFLVYQPIFDLRTRNVLGVEALIRWLHPTHGIINPDAFIPIAEETGLIAPIGRWVLHEACGQLAVWQKAGHAVGVSVNVSAYQLDRDGLTEDVAHALADSGIDPTLLTLEITESALMHDVPAAARRLGELKTLGVRLAIDDFGTGYSSLAYLRQFPVDALKIDRSFISNLATSEEATAIIQTLVQLGKTLQIDTLAEGIEDSDQLEHLQRADCDQGQGFLFARPLSATAIQEFLAATSDETTPKAA
jgi:diguanylate cyclase (GGDEF)-like protein